MPGSLHSSRAGDTMVEVLQQELAGGTLILTPNARSARDLRARYAARQRSAGLGAWNAPNVLPWSAWLTSQWNELLASGVEERLLLNPLQERSVWSEIIALDRDLPGAEQRQKFSRLAMRAYRLVADFQVTADLSRAAGGPDAKTFARWFARFRNECAAKGYLPNADLAGAVRIHVERGTLQPVARIVLFGWGEQTAVQTTLLDSLSRHGTEVASIQAVVAPEADALRAVVPCDQPDQEWEVASRWARRFIAEGARQGCLRKVALIVPGLAEKRAELEPVLRRVLAPELENIAADVSATPYVFCAGDTLHSYPVIVRALELLRWLGGPLPLERAGNLLFSPYVGSSGDAIECAEFDAYKLRRHSLLTPEISIDEMAKLAEEQHAPLAVRRLCSALLRREPAIVGKRRYAEWMELARNVLRDAGWPGDRPLQAREFAATVQWEHALDAVATLDFSGARVEFGTALAALSNQCLESAVPAALDAPVQVLTPDEAAGSTFDAVLFLHLVEDSWPTQERIHPLLPWALQCEYAMPGTSPEKAMQRGHELLATLTASAPNVLLFHAKHDDAGALRFSAPAARLGWPVMPPDQLDLCEVPDLTVAPVQLADETPIPRLAAETEVRGGASVLQLQARCAFLAFAQMRLGARELETPSLGFDSRELGNVVHVALDEFWREMKDQATLRAATADQRERVLTQAAAKALPKPAGAGAWESAYLGVQRERLLRLLRSWSTMELRRGPFRVLQHEKDSRATIGPLKLTVRQDRVDEIDGGLAIVDYKTGRSAKPADWWGERPDEPQLPLYALLTEQEQLRAVLFAKLLPGKDMKWTGCADEDGVLPKRTRMQVDSMPAQIEAWRSVLTNLAEDFAAGEAAANPKHYPKTCRLCAQRTLCRLDTATLISADDEVIDGE